MSAYNARRAPNVSRYLANLNTMPSPPDSASQQQNLAMADNSLDFLTNTEFFDFDQFNPTAATAAFDPQLAQGDLKDAQHYPYPDFHGYMPDDLASPSLPLSPSSGLVGGFPHMQFAATSPNTGDKRQASVAGLPSHAGAGVGSVADLEETSRMAAEEDKRRRNTAASARFRVKKKQREQALEKQAKEMSDKVQALESKVQQLEMENKWLKELITEKTESSGKAVGETVSIKSDRDAAERSTESRTDGVGTEAAA